MSLFRPSRTVTTPSGDYWELYVSKTVLPTWSEGRADASESGDALTGTELDLLGLPTRAVRIEAVSPYPVREVLLWTTLMRVLPLLRAEASVDALASLGAAGADAYELADELPPGPARDAAWCAFALQTYGDKLVGAGRRTGATAPDTAQVARTCFALAETCLGRARQGAALDLPERLPHWRTPIRSREQLVGMREALEALRTHLAFELRGLPEGDELHAELAALDERLETAARFWIERPPDEIRGAVGDALTTGLDRAYALGRALATGSRAAPAPARSPRTAP